MEEWCRWMMWDDDLLLFSYAFFLFTFELYDSLTFIAEYDIPQIDIVQSDRDCCSSCTVWYTVNLNDHWFCLRAPLVAGRVTVAAGKASSKPQTCFPSLFFQPNTWKFASKCLLRILTKSNVIKPLGSDFDTDILYTHTIKVDRLCAVTVQYILFILTVCGSTNYMRHLQQK